MKIDFGKRAQELFPAMQTLRRHLHQYPELSFQEVETSAFIQHHLSGLSVDYRVIAGTGVLAHIGKGSKCVALRADIDALPITEETGLEFASRTDGVMHACGHDTHTTMLLAAAQMLKEHESSLGGVVKLLFQPGEEKVPGGASLMIAEGALTDPIPSVIFGQHINPASPVGEVSFVSGPMMASADELYWTITGTGAHAAQPHLGRDPIFAAAGLIHHLQSFITRRRNPLEPAVLTITSIHGGSATNIIPDVVELKGTLRTFATSVREDAWAFLEEQTKQYCSLHGCDGSVHILKGYPPLINDEQSTDFARTVAVSSFGEHRVAAFEPKMWAEDFSFYSHHIPACFWMLGGRPADTAAMPGLHNPKFSPDETAMITGSALLASVAAEALSR
ncbi:MAG: amidohydrolase [Ignavibacteria bacterium]|nr:amidohydrolase [Ignavibacteria bacterium]